MRYREVRYREKNEICFAFVSVSYQNKPDIVVALKGTMDRLQVLNQVVVSQIGENGQIVPPFVMQD